MFMKNTITTKILILFMFFWIASIEPSIAQPGNPPPPPSEHGGNSNVPGGGAPIGGGIILLLTMGLGYGTLKVAKAKKGLVE